jgi:hypothetical protein
MNICLVSDFYSDEIIGGAELCNDALITNLEKNNISVKKYKSNNISLEEINSNNFYIIANFFLLSQQIKDYLIIKKINYVIYEHDHKYVSTNNPSLFPNFNIDEQFIINKEFYRSAIAVLAQSKIHAEIIQKNLLLNNIINLSGNIWSNKDLDILKKYSNSEKSIKYGIIKTNNKNKGMNQSIEYCMKNNFQYNLIPQQEYENFIDSLSKVQNLVFFPQWLETFSRLAVEAKILNCKLITNKFIGAASEEFFKLPPKELLYYLEENNKKIVDIFIYLIKNKTYNFNLSIDLPKVSIITSLYKGSKFIEHFIQDITKQTIFNECELIIIDANSPENEHEIIKKYIDNYNNIKYIKLDKRLNVHETLNKGIELSKGQYITIANVDDRRTIDCLEVLRKHLFNNKHIDLVYGDCLITDVPNQNVENCTSKDLYEHSILEFSKENMIKCLPGPIPMWKREMSIKNGKFNELLHFVGDWEFWLRCVQNGSLFKKVNKLVGSYYYNPEGLSTDKKNIENKLKEERKIFLDYKNIIGYNNFEKYRKYFNV